MCDRLNQYLSLFSHIDICKFWSSNSSEKHIVFSNTNKHANFIWGFFFFFFHVYQLEIKHTINSHRKFHLIRMGIDCLWLYSSTISYIYIYDMMIGVVKKELSIFKKIKWRSLPRFSGAICGGNRPRKSYETFSITSLHILSFSSIFFCHVLMLSYKTVKFVHGLRDIIIIVSFTTHHLPE